ncbi:MAG: DEAD/DEAH box helicase [Anaeromyxobacter sp.]
MATYRPEAALIVQSDGTILAEVGAPDYPVARAKLARFAELAKSPEHVHTYRITPLSLWNAAASGMGEAEVVAALLEHSKYDVPQNILAEVREQLGRYGRLWLEQGDRPGVLLLRASDPYLARVLELSRAGALLGRQLEPGVFELPVERRGDVKQALIAVGWPVDDRAGVVPGEGMPCQLRSVTVGGAPFALRPYQSDAVELFAAGGAHGVICLPCGAGKTLVGLGAMARFQESTLVLCASTTAARQWLAEALDRTTLQAGDAGEYTGAGKSVRPFTVATYQILTHRPGGRKPTPEAPLRAEDFPHFELFNARRWGLIIYDEVHLLPAPVFRMTAAIQSRRRLGLTATLVREDGHEGDVFCLVGPKRHDVPWKDLEESGFIASAVCCEIRVGQSPAMRMTYLALERRDQHRFAAANPRKLDVVKALVARHPGEPVLVIGTYLGMLRRLAQQLGAPIVDGGTPQPVREGVFAAFRQGKHPVLVLSKVGNFSIDLPDASVCIQVSGNFGSRQEEAQRLGRILRPKARQAWFYTVITRDTEESRFAFKRQLFLGEQGYAYLIEDWEQEVPEGSADSAEAPPLPPPALPGEAPAGPPDATVISLSDERDRRRATLH